MSCFQNLMQNRRSIYKIGNQTTLSETEIEQLVESCLFNAPTAFNAQSSRVVLLLGESYQIFWKMVSDTLEKHVPSEAFPKTKEKINSFSAGIGTVLFFEDEKTLRELQNKYPIYADNFPNWAEQGNGILQYMVWTAFFENDLGATLQHYNPLIDKQTKQLFQLPKSWRLIAQMPFGSIEAPADTKTHLPMEERIRVFK